ncbi:formyl transferase-like protein [Roseibium hamelinense]|uniref:phosphoribosylglycinamide formyltransferase 1 n=1 Tax=Roseibium hamelinense TaxID=150831 RepID=A0A562TI51_9HYPH|nr:formyl transferase [Roseibium hamelinense]MTI45774.1 hypothetical protein [Roseibium hamelinense]TWI93043.1 formyl transferase-like protein [Roseibium hamelinense]
MRIVILTDNSDRHFYFCNKIIAETGGVVGVVTGGKEIRRSAAEEFKRAWGRHFARTVQKRVFQVLYKNAGLTVKAEKKRAEKAAFGGETQRFADRYNHLHLAAVGPDDRSINDARFVELVRAQKPDLIVVMGTCLIGRRLMDCAPLVLNMHTGLSPYYRGGRTNFWPFVEGEPGYFGVTIHKMSGGIDAGDILHSRRIAVSAGDDFGTINSRAIVTGTDLMIDVIRRVSDGSAAFLPQWTCGRLYFDKDWDFRKASVYLRNRDRVVQAAIAQQDDGGASDIATVDNGKQVFG